MGVKLRLFLGPFYYVFSYVTPKISAASLSSGSDIGTQTFCNSRFHKYYRKGLTKFIYLKKHKERNRQSTMKAKESVYITSYFCGKFGLTSLKVNKIRQSLPRNHFEYLSENVFVKCPYKIAIIELNYTSKQKMQPYPMKCNVIKINIQCCLLIFRKSLLFKIIETCKRYKLRNGLLFPDQGFVIPIKSLWRILRTCCELSQLGSSNAVQPHRRLSAEESRNLIPHMGESPVRSLPPLHLEV